MCNLLDLMLRNLHNVHYNFIVLAQKLLERLDSILVNAKCSNFLPIPQMSTLSSVSSEQ